MYKVSVCVSQTLEFVVLDGAAPHGWVAAVCKKSINIVDEFYQFTFWLLFDAI